MTEDLSLSLYISTLSSLVRHKKELDDDFLLLS